ncbi:hypothetical protein KK062_06765 [Fulvivirgaceae bacterium PWU5]|uniref:Uncharacterized protein n=1 Tax=Dawidia cretensis TaxID=2782350 RepID=A0AAP2DY45_9BACT|nr:hypothetical protein [Dawidia cretensis]MBT1707914.1 hypothetical protein [Dawidia cretensis]
MSISHHFPKFVKLLKEENVNIDLLVEQVEECIAYFQSGYSSPGTDEMDLSNNPEYKRLIFFHHLLLSIRTHFYGTIAAQALCDNDVREQRKLENFEIFLRAFNMRFKDRIL